MAEQLHVVIGAGPVGWTTAEHLAAAGHRVRVVTRSGTGPDHVETRRADATDAAAMTAEIAGAAAFYNCVNPAYHRWAQDWPPVHQALMHTATATGAVYVLMDNLYAYGPNGGSVMRETDPLRATGTKGRTRATMATELLAAHESGRLRAAIARAGDFVGPRVIEAALGERVVPRVLAGKAVKVLGDADAPHSFTYIPDVARTLVALGTDARAWGSAWHVPSAPAVSQRQYVDALAAAAGTRVRVGTIPWAALWAAGLVIPTMRELRETWYQFAEPFVMDSGAAESTFDITPTPLAQQAADTVAWWREGGHRAA